jgi:hypothetical protein
MRRAGGASTRADTLGGLRYIAETGLFLAPEMKTERATPQMYRGLTRVRRPSGEPRRRRVERWHPHPLNREKLLS